MKDICKEFLSRYEINFESVYFIYAGSLLNLELTFNESNYLPNSYFKR